MFARREARLLFALAVLLGAAALAAAVSLGAERLRDAREKNGVYRAQIVRLQQSLQSLAELSALQEHLKARLESEKARFYSPREIDPYSFGVLIRKMLGARGMEVVRYQVTALEGRSSLEFVVSGSIRSLVLFLQEISDSRKYWGISSLSLTMRESSAMVDAVFRIGYEEMDH
ncbi:MAG: hypothetical protein ACLQDL_02055 [Spirochaetia bacterium]